MVRNGTLHSMGRWSLRRRTTPKSKTAGKQGGTNSQSKEPDRGTLLELDMRLFFEGPFVVGFEGTPTGKSPKGGPLILRHTHNPYACQLFAPRSGRHGWTLPALLSQPKSPSDAAAWVFDWSTRQQVNPKPTTKNI